MIAQFAGREVNGGGMGVKCKLLENLKGYEYYICMLAYDVCKCKLFNEISLVVNSVTMT